MGLIPRIRPIAEQDLTPKGSEARSPTETWANPGHVLSERSQSQGLGLSESTYVRVPGFTRRESGGCLVGIEGEAEKHSFLVADENVLELTGEGGPI